MHWAECLLLLLLKDDGGKKEVNQHLKRGKQDSKETLNQKGAPLCEG